MADQEPRKPSYEYYKKRIDELIPHVRASAREALAQQVAAAMQKQPADPK